MLHCTPEDLQEALSLIELRELSIRAASKQFNIDMNLISRRNRRFSTLSIFHGHYHIQRKQGELVIDGFNPSAEEATEGTEDGVESGVDIVLNHRLCESFAFGDKKGFTAYLKDYMKKLVQKLEETNPDQVSVFKNNTNKVMKDILGRFKDLQFFTGESMDIDGMVSMLEYRDIDGDSVPVMMFFKHGLEEEKF